MYTLDIFGDRQKEMVYIYIQYTYALCPHKLTVSSIDKYSFLQCSTIGVVTKVIH